MEKYCYEWVSGACCQPRIKSFLQAVDSDMIPSISARVDIDDYSMKLAVNADTLFISAQSEKDIASCSLYCNQETAFISSIVVRAAFQRRGIGGYMINKVKERAKSRRCAAIRLEVYQSNRNAINYYVQNKFAIVTRKREWLLMEFAF